MVKIIKPIEKTRILPYAHGLSLGKSAVRQTGWKEIVVLDLGLGLAH
jgi:hypothetical protein